MILDGKPYLCAIPVVENPAQNQTAFAQAKAKAEKEEAAELTRATARGLELLKDMEGSCMYFISGWWSYSFCYNTQVKQFHQLPPGKDTPVYPPVEDKSTPSYILGRFDKKEGRNTGHQQGKESHDTVALGEMQAKGESRYLVQRLGGGTLCDLTGRPRRVEVQFHCYPQSGDRIGWIKEVATCSYVMVVYTQRLCNDVAFLPPRETKANAITCRQIVKESDIADWQQSQHPTFPPTYRDPKFVSSGSSRPVVAGIEVGGMVQVGKPGARLEAPKIFVQADGAIMAMGDSTNSRFLAKQEAADKGGKLEKVSDEEVREIGLDPEDVAEVRQRLKKYANGKAWRLDAIEGPDGINFRGIFEGVDEDAGMSYDRPAARQDDERRGADADGAEDEGEGEEGEEEERRGSLEDLKDEL
jgi:protein OS-9